MVAEAIPWHGYGARCVCAQGTLSACCWHAVPAEAAARQQGDERDLSVAFNRLGDVQDARGEFASALKSYNDSLAIVDQLAKSEPGNAEWQRHLSALFIKIGDEQAQQGDLAVALKSYSDSLAIAESLAQSDPAMRAGSGICRWPTTGSVTSRRRMATSPAL
jgi:tetratricopeptide (TPR) repeat protein